MIKIRLVTHDFDDDKRVMLVIPKGVADQLGWLYGDLLQADIPVSAPDALLIERVPNDTK